jgi:hypothetical protein
MDKIVSRSGLGVVMKKNGSDGNFIAESFEVELGQGDEFGIAVAVREILATVRMT